MLPERQFEVVSELAPTEIHDRLVAYVGPLVVGGLKGDRPYVGTVALASFDLTPSVDAQNRFRPHAEGRVVPNGDGSLVSVKMRMLPLSRALVMAWLVVASLAWVSVIAAVVRDGILRGFAWPQAIPVVFVAVFPLLGVVVPRSRFRREARPLEEFLRKALDRNETP